ncbi:precorrin-3B C17-methyltransferase [Desulfarculales bacterium]
MLYVIGLGPGGPKGITEQARQALAGCQVVLGYKAYVEQAAPWLTGQEVLTSGMTKELRRAALAVEKAQAGQSVALISGGDPGIYAMAAVVFELARARGLDLGPNGLEVEVIPGVPAMAAAAALLGAPLSHDFACISLSDRLTPWELIERRLDLAAQADLVIALYNPKSKGRAWQFGRALEIIGRHRAAATPVGVVTQAQRPGQAVLLNNLGQTREAAVDMQTIVIIGNSQSYAYQKRMITPRGYVAKYGEQ